MAVLVGNIRQYLNDSSFDCFAEARRKAGVPQSQVLSCRIFRRSVDARRRDKISIVYSVWMVVADESRIKPSADVRLVNEPQTDFTIGKSLLDARPVIVGFGPAGIFCALTLARHGYRPLVLERGADIAERAAAVEAFFAGGPFSPISNVQFGAGGAGTFSDGKLTTRIGDAVCGEILRTFVRHGAPEEILYSAKPHIGTDILREVISSLRAEICALGGEVRFLTAAEDFRFENGRLRGVTAGGTELAAQVCVLAIGHSARDTFELLLRKGVAMEAKPFSVGARIEHLQTDIDRSLYGAAAGHPLLPQGEYQLSHREPDGRAVYTFCMCPGGTVVPAASEAGGTVTNGMSLHARSGANANAALVVSVGPADFGTTPLSGVAFQRELERAAYGQTGSFRAPVQSAGRLLAGKSGAEFGRIAPSYPIGTAEGDFTKIFPPFVQEEMRKGLRLFSRNLACFGDADAILTAPETRTSSPVRILRGETGESAGFAGLYPCGEGCGYAGGIMSAAADGIHTAQRIMETYKPFD